jgi:hypothetical protein
MPKASLLDLPSDTFYESLAESRVKNKSQTFRASGTMAWPVGLEMALDLNGNSLP